MGKYRRDKKKRSPWSRYPWDTGWSQDTLMGYRDQCTTLWWEAGYVHNHKEFLTCFQRKLQQQWRHLVDVTFQRKSLTHLIGVCRSPTGIFDLMNWKSIAPVPWHFCHNKLPWTGMGVVWAKHRHFLFQVLHPGMSRSRTSCSDGWWGWFSGLVCRWTTPCHALTQWQGRRWEASSMSLLVRALTVFTKISTSSQIYFPK